MACTTQVERRFAQRKYVYHRIWHDMFELSYISMSVLCSFAWFCTVLSNLRVTVTVSSSQAADAVNTVV
jgi:hypothetical protein